MDLVEDFSFCKLWTVSGLLSKLLAVPYYFPFSKSGSKLKQTFSVECLPSAVALTDILTDFGYKCVFSMGSEKNFEYRDILLESHGYEIHDISWYKKNGFLCENYKIFWELTEGILAEIFLLGAGPERKRWKDIQRIFL